MPNDMTLTQQYEENRDLLTGMLYKRGTSGVVERYYSYDTLGRPLTRQQNRQGGSRNDAFTHNDRSELTAGILGPKGYYYTYDNIGNRKTAKEDADEATNYEANALNQYTVVGDFEPEFDADGNQTKVQTSTGIWNVTYNAENRPVVFERTNDDGTITKVTCVYDYKGRRDSKKVETVSVDAETEEPSSVVILHQRYIYRGYLQVVCCDLTESGHPCRWFITWDPTQPVSTRPLAIRKDGTWYAYGWDLTKNVCEVFSNEGYINNTVIYSYTPYGAVTAEGSVTQPIQWSSEFYDNELGLVYYNYRHYNPYDGRWTVKDMVFQENLYSYVGNNSYDVDILGLALIDSLKESIIESFRQILYDTVIKAGEFSSQRLPRLFLKKYIYQETSEYVLSKNELLNEVKPMGTIARCSSFMNAVKSKCKGKQVVFSDEYIVPFFDSGHKTGGLGNFSMKVTAKVNCCGKQKWEVSGSATMLTDPWDFNSSLSAAIKETIDLLELKISGKIPLLAGRELRTYLGSYIPGTPFNITSNEVLTAREKSDWGYMVLE